MCTAPVFDHEKLKAYQASLESVAYASELLETIPGKIAARDPLDRASTSAVLNLAEGNGKRSHAERCRFFDTARGSAVECAACLDILQVKKQITAARGTAGKAILIEVVSMTAGLIARFSEGTREDGADYGLPTEEKE